MNLELGKSQAAIKFCYSIIMIYNIGMNYLALYDIIGNIAKSYRYPAKDELRLKPSHRIIIALTSNKMLSKLIVIVPTILMGYYIKGINSVFMLNGSVFINILQLILPCLMIMKLQNLKLQNMSKRMKLILQRKSLGKELALGPLAMALSEELRHHGGK